jgi:hypothetical protein
VSSVRVEGNLAAITFDRFDLESYDLFLRAKALPESRVAYDWKTDSYTLTTPARFAARLGTDTPAAERTPVPLASHLFDYQRWIAELALAAKRIAVWCDTGLGKTAIYLEWARQVQRATGGRVLILAPLQVIGQICDEWRRFYPEEPALAHLASREQVTTWCMTSADRGLDIGITNYEKLIPGQMPEFRHLAGLVCDESSVLKSGGGVIKWNLIHSAKGVEYKLSATATPAPNDTMEYASQASFLECLRTEGEILWTYFERDKHDNWIVKPHARQAFYEFMASWSVYMRNPAHFGFADILSTLPPPEIREYELPLAPAQREMMYGLLGPKGGLFNDDRLTLAERSRLSQLASGFLYRKVDGRQTAARYESAKPIKVADLVAGDVRDGRQVLVWTVFDEEGEIIPEYLPADVEHAVLSGKQSEAARDDLIRRFKAGDIPVLISKASLIGHGLNFQNCRSMVFSSFDDSFERMYQAIRRAYRFGQRETVRVHIPHIPELQGTVFSNIKRKQALFDRDTAAQERHYRAVLMGGAA